jgi:archaellin
MTKMVKRDSNHNTKEKTSMYDPCDAYPDDTHPSENYSFSQNPFSMNWKDYESIILQNRNDSLSSNKKVELIQNIYKILIEKQDLSILEKLLK